MLRGKDWANGNALAAEATTPGAGPALAAAANDLHGQLAESLALVGFRTSSALADGGEQRHWASLTFQIGVRDSTSAVTRYVLATVNEKDSLGRLWVVGVQIEPLAGPLERINAFSLSGKSPAHYLTFGLAVLIPLFVLGAEVVCFRAPIRRRWAWMVVTLLGAPVTSFNWATGEAHTASFDVLLLGGGWLRASAYAPVIILWAFPMGAVIFLARRYQLIVQARHTSKEGYTKLNLPDGV
ncbi:MAG TPA: hypothetical protein VNA31_04885 [bacterium]|nr:hypothetical protein [bacterium]